MMDSGCARDCSDVHHLNPLSTFGFAAAALFLVPACDSGGSGDTDGGSTSSTTTTTTSPPTTTATTGTPPGSTSSSTTDDSGSTTGGSSTSGSTTDDSTSTTGGSSSTTDAPGSTGSSSSSTGEAPSDCVDEDIFDAVGEDVASGQNDGQGDDFSLRFCFGGPGGGGGATSFGSDTDAFETTGVVATTGFGDTGSFGTSGGSTSGFGTDGFGTDGFGSTGGFGDGDDYVISWTPPSTGPFVIDTVGSTMDTVLSVVPPKCGASRTVCNDDCNTLESGLIFEATEDETVYIVVEGYAGGSGTFTLNITEGDDLDCEFFGGDTDGSSTVTTVATDTTAGSTSP